ncbi:hypothetical protein JL107_03825 [Nakamurella flavida]|uniref:Major facilitator superfamily (MFS) profile domain-containing protein n=1 Tax=Nakamurella flavida TaxID=363630 RepID=A0A938YM42_9ACTN|nr:MFS transporter [Nakamurella flavida]MBM9475568.1 hypothetical protein [Nakamurella flavida]MDP9778156.1 MFS family permease [Nakamurella flavida]
MSLITPFRVLPALAGRTLLPVAFLARLPSSMTQLGTVVLVSTAYDSVGAGGLTAGALAIGSAGGGPVLGALSARLGQRPVLLAASLLNAAGAAAIVVTALLGAPLWAVCLAALVCGTSTPQIGALVRARWVGLTRGGPGLPAAMSYEGAADEVGYILGPAVVSLLAALASPAAAVLASAALVGVFGSWVALHPTSAAAPVAHHGPRPAGTPRWLTGTVVRVLFGGTAVGCFFGAMQTGVTGVATASGSPGAAGSIYAFMAVGSAVTALAVAALPARFALPDRLVFFAAAMAVLTVPALLADGVGWLIAAILPLGCAVGPYLITVYSLAERSVSTGRVAVVMTSLGSAVTIGYFVGSTLGGALVDRVSPAAAFGVATAAATGALLNAVLLRVRGLPAAVED